MSETSDQELIQLSSQVGEILKKRNLTIATAESCTGGLLSHILTAVSGSSTYFMGGVVAYSNFIKEQILGVSENTLIKFGAVSKQTALEMAVGIQRKFETNIGISTTGIAGPTGGTPEKPVGLVWMCIAIDNRKQAFTHQFQGNRSEVKIYAVREILNKLLNMLESSR